MLAAGFRTPEDEYRVLGVLRDAVASGADHIEFSASWVSTQANVDPRTARSILTTLATTERYIEPWLTARIRLRCPIDDRDLGTIAVDEEMPSEANCPEDGEVEIDPDRNEIIYWATPQLLEDAQKKTLTVKNRVVRLATIVSKRIARKSLSTSEKQGRPPSS